MLLLTKFIDVGVVVVGVRKRAEIMCNREQVFGRSNSMACE